MTAYEIGELIGSAVLVAVVTGLLYLVTKRWVGRYGKAVFIHMIALLIIIPWSAIGAADGGPPNFQSAAYYLPAQSLLLAADLLRLAFRRREPAHAG
jgi:hypothetical protein